LKTPIILKIDNKEILRKACPQCGDAFLPLDAREEFCSESCKKRYEGKKKKYHDHSKKFNPEEQAWLENHSDGIEPLFLERDVEVSIREAFKKIDGPRKKDASRTLRNRIKKQIGVLHSEV
jgi:hypothetical protein